MIRAIESVLPPVAKGTTILMGLFGQVGACAKAILGMQANKPRSKLVRRPSDRFCAKEGLAEWAFKKFMVVSFELKMKLKTNRSCKGLSASDAVDHR